MGGAALGHPLGTGGHVGIVLALVGESCRGRHRQILHQQFVDGFRQVRQPGQDLGALLIGNRAVGGQVDDEEAPGAVHRAVELAHKRRHGSRIEAIQLRQKLLGEGDRPLETEIRRNSEHDGTVHIAG